jgi:hypothetical protein
MHQALNLVPCYDNGSLTPPTILNVVEACGDVDYGVFSMRSAQRLAGQENQHRTFSFTYPVA